MIHNSHGLTTAAVSRENLCRIAALFELQGPFEVFDFPYKGNINRQTYLILAGQPGAREEYVLQMLNPQVFSQPRAVMKAMVSCIQAQEEALSRSALQGENEEWEPIRLVSSRDGKAYVEVADEEGIGCWRMMARIRDSRFYRSLGEIQDSSERLRVAQEAGKGLAFFGILTALREPSEIGCPIPGYRDTSLYYDQLMSVLAGNRTLLEAAAHLPQDPAVRQSTETHFLIHIHSDEYKRRLEDPKVRRCITLALNEKQFCLKLQRSVRAGDLKKVVVHGDTKLENFLFSTRTGKVKALVDLDTVMQHTWLTDWGDAVRSLINIAGEQQSEPERIEVDLKVFEALARGFLGIARCADLKEPNLMAEAGQIMALELGVRFLTDYLRGDTYFRLQPSDGRDLNRTRALVQFSIFEKLRNEADHAKQIIGNLYRHLNSSRSMDLSK